MPAKDIDYRIAFELRQVVGADDGVVVPAPDIIHARLKFNDVLQSGLVSDHPIHSAHNAAEREPSRRISGSKLFESLKHSVLVEFAIAKIGFGVNPDFQLPGLLSNRRVDSRRSQPTQVLVPLAGIYDMNRLVAALKSLFNEWEQHAVLFVFVRTGIHPLLIDYQSYSEHPLRSLVKIALKPIFHMKSPAELTP